MAYFIEYKKTAIKNLADLPKETAKKIKVAIDDLADNPTPTGYKKLKGLTNAYRIRIGTYRVVYEIHKNEILIFIIKIGHRKDIYK